MIGGGPFRPSTVPATGNARRGAWLATAVYFAATCLAHLQFSLWLVRPRETPWGTLALSAFAPGFMAAGAALLAMLILRQLLRRPRRWQAAAPWLAWALAVLAIDRWLTFSVNEYFHYPQYALLAWLLARSLDPRRERWLAGRVLFWTTLLGAADELLQYLWITTSYSHYFDFNDVLVNLVAGAAGVLLYYGPAKQPYDVGAGRSSAVVETVALTVLALVVCAGVGSGRLRLEPTTAIAPGGLALDPGGRHTLYLQRAPGLHGSWQPAPHRGRHYVLGPIESLLGLAAISAMIIVASGRATPSQASGRDDAASTMPPSNAVKST